MIKEAFQKIPQRFRNPVYAGLAAAGVAGGAALAANEDGYISGIVIGVNNEDRLPGARLPWAAGETWFLTAGPHSDGDSGGVREAVDFTPTERPVACTSPSIKSDKFARAVAEGTVIRSGQGTNRRHPDWSVVEIEHESINLAYEHLADIQVKVGDEVEPGTALGKPSCEVSPGGRTTGLHVHIEEKDEYGRSQPIKDLVLGGWQIKESRGNYQGTVVKKGEQTRTAEEGRCGPDAESIRKCGGIRNDLTWGSTDNPDSLIKPTLTFVPTHEPIPTELPPDFIEPTPGPSSFFCSKAPESGFRDISGNAKNTDVKIEDYLGQVVVIFMHYHSFKASREALIYVKNLEVTYSGHLVLLTVIEDDYEDVPANITAIVGNSPVIVPTVKGNTFSNDYQIRGTPSAALIGRDGLIVGSVHGSVEIISNFATEIEAEINGSGKC